MKVLQEFVSIYLRNPNYREHFKRNPESAFELIGANENERDLINKLNIIHLDFSVESLIKERKEKRKVEFDEFLRYLEKLVDIDSFFNIFLSMYPSGLLNRKVEMNRFVEFSKHFIKENNLPDILIDLLDYCYRVTNISDMPRLSKEIANKKREHNLKAKDCLMILGPFEIVKYKYDLNLLLEHDLKIEQLLNIVPKSTTFLFQKSYTEVTSCKVLGVEKEDEEFFDLLVKEESIEKIQNQLAINKNEINENITYLTEEKIIAVKP